MLDNRFDDRQSEAASARGLPCRVDFVEPIEDVWQVFGRNARPGIADENTHTGRRLLGDDRDLAALRRVSQRVRRQVLKRLLQALGITGYDGGIGMNLAGEANGTRVELAFVACRDSIDQTVDVHRLAPECCAAAFEPCEVEE